jgi:hypothetical protein
MREREKKEAREKGRRTGADVHLDNTVLDS